MSHTKIWAAGKLVNYDERKTVIGKVRRFGSNRVLSSIPALPHVSGRLIKKLKKDSPALSLLYNSSPLTVVNTLVVCFFVFHKMIYLVLFLFVF